jgi:hypothetical protein
VKDDCLTLNLTSGLTPRSPLAESIAWLHSQRRKLLVAAAAGMSTTMLLLAGCGPVKLVASTNIPPPLVVKVPIGVALFIPTDFASYVHKEERWSTNWHIELGKAQTEGITRLMAAMFERVVTVESVNAGTQVPGGGVAAILEPSIEEYAFVTPRDAGSPFYAVSIKYRVNVYLPDGKLADSWGFTGYGTSPAQGLSSEAPLSAATALAMRDAGAKLAVEFREQAVMRGLLPEAPTADAPPGMETPAAPGASTTPAAPGASTSPATPAPVTPPAPTVIETPAATTPENGSTAPPSSPPAAPEPAEEDAAKETTGSGEPPKNEDAAVEPKPTEKKIPKQPPEPPALALAG